MLKTNSKLQCGHCITMSYTFSETSGGDVADLYNPAVPVDLLAEVWEDGVCGKDIIDHLRPRTGYSFHKGTLA